MYRFKRSLNGPLHTPPLEERWSHTANSLDKMSFITPSESSTSPSWSSRSPSQLCCSSMIPSITVPTMLFLNNSFCTQWTYCGVVFRAVITPWTSRGHCIGRRFCFDGLVGVRHNMVPSNTTIDVVVTSHWLIPDWHWSSSFHKDQRHLQHLASSTETISISDVIAEVCSSSHLFGF